MSIVALQKLTPEMVDMLEEASYYRYKDTRKEYTKSFHTVPRVSKILETCMDSSYLTSWANSLGLKGKVYEEVLNKYADYGTKTHNEVEEYIRNGTVPEKKSSSFIAFEKWWKMITTQHQWKVIGMEEKLVSPWFGGTYDMLMEIDDNRFLVDFKTSSRISFRYCLQLSAYHLLMQYNNLPEIDGIIILRLPRNNPNFEECVYHYNDYRHRKFLEHCEDTFIHMVYTYWSLCVGEAEFIRLQKG